MPGQSIEIGDDSDLEVVAVDADSGPNKRQRREDAVSASKPPAIAPLKVDNKGAIDLDSAPSAAKDSKTKTRDSSPGSRPPLPRPKKKEKEEKEKEKKKDKKKEKKKEKKDEKRARREASKSAESSESAPREKLVECPNCKGSGSLADLIGWPMCTDCDGLGRVTKVQAAALERRAAMNPGTKMETCPDCNGDCCFGSADAKKIWVCKTCDGLGRIEQSSEPSWSRKPRSDSDYRRRDDSDYHRRDDSSYHRRDDSGYHRGDDWRDDSGFHRRDASDWRSARW